MNKFSSKISFCLATRKTFQGSKARMSVQSRSNPIWYIESEAVMREQRTCISLGTSRSDFVIMKRTAEDDLEKAVPSQID